MTNIQAFINKWTGRRINFDGIPKYAGQCTQVVKQFAKESGWQVPNGGGADALGYMNFTNGYRYMKNYPWTIPQAGDFAIFQIGRTGHIALVVSATVWRLNVFEQNYPNSGSACHQSTYNYISPKCLGFLRKI